MINNMKDLKLVIIGLGYVGLPLALEFAKKRKVIGNRGTVFTVYGRKSRKRRRKTKRRKRTKKRRKRRQRAQSA